MKLLLSIALLTMGIALPGCVRSIGAYETHPRHLQTYNDGYYDRGHYHRHGNHYHYRGAPRPYSPYSRSFGEPRYYEPARRGIEFHVSD